MLVKAREWYWVPHPTRVWTAVLVQSVSKNSCWVTTADDPIEFELETSECPFLPVNPRTVDDMTSLLYLHEAAILENLYERSKPQYLRPYTYVSNVLIAVNPLRKIEIPSMENYKNRPMSGQDPHPYGIAELSYKQMTLLHTKHKNQSIIISGESGAGKTETAKIVLRYLCWRASDESNPNSSLFQKAVSASLDKRLLDTNPILESFGNAQTLRNPNSSRFGKLFKLYFDPNQSHKLVSAGMVTYLLEKSRVVSFSEGERNFHVFYQMIDGATAVERKKWHLKDKTQYHYLDQSSVYEIESVNDKDEFLLLTSSMLSVGIGSAEQDMIFRLLSGILSLGNITFNEKEVSSGAAVDVSEPHILSKAAEMIGVDKDRLGCLLTSRILDMSSGGASRRGSSYRIPLDSIQAIYARDAVSKSIYKMVFDWIVHRIRRSLEPEGIDHASLPHIGVLDIFGFESFEENGLEQLLINYANESLQLSFNQSVLQAEQELYIDEGMMIAPVNYIDNSSCVELIARSKDSIINTLDSVCRAPGPTEEKFNSILHQIHANKPNFPKPEPRFKRDTFVIKHYAQSVVYTVGTFIPKNMDTVPSELDMLLCSSVYTMKHDIFNQGISMNEEAHTIDPSEYHSNRVSATFESYGNPMLARSELAYRERESSVVSGIDEDNPLYSNEMKSRLQLFSKDPQKPATKVMPRIPAKKTRTDTVGTTFIKQMSSLCHHLDSTTCTFIRCVKPNSSMTPGLFEHKFVMDQVRVLGIVQTCEVLKQGLPSRVHYLEIETMYRSKFTERVRHLVRHLDEISFTKAVLWSLNIPRSKYELGKTRIFFTSSNISAMDLLLRVNMDKEEGIALMNGVVRYVIRNYWRRALLYARVRCEVLKLYKWCQIRCKCAVVVQRVWRKYIGSLRRIRKQQLRALWRKAIYYTVSCNILLENYLLIRGATEMRLRAEAAAEERMRLLQEEERKRSETIEIINNRRRLSSVSLGNALGNIVSRLSMNEENVFRGSTLTSVDEVDEDDDEEMKSAIQATESARAKSEMRALVAASALATVSVCLFRWTKIKLFQAFEKWHEVSFYSDETPTGPGRTRVLSMLQKTRQGSQRHSRVEVDEKGIETQTPPCVCFECQDRTAQLWCSSCLQPYCPVCSQFVHSSCRLMKNHRIQPISQRKSVEVTPQAVAFAVAETMKGAVKSLITESMFPDLKDGSARYLYFGRIQPGGGSQTETDSTARRRSNTEDEFGRARRGTISGVQSGGRSYRRGSVLGGMGFSRLGATEKGKNACAIKSCQKEACMGISIRFCEEHYEEFRSSLKSGFGKGDDDKESEKFTLQQQVALLKKQLQDSGQQPVEFVELSVARQRMQEAVQRLIGGDEAAEKDIEKWDKAIRMNPEYQKELEEKARQWEEDQKEKNLECLRTMRTLVPPNIRQTSFQAMVDEGLPKTIATRVWTKKTLWMVRMHSDDIKRIHIADLRTKYGNQGLDIIEMRAIYACLPMDFDNDGDGKKAEWRSFFRQKLEELTVKEQSNRLSNPEKRNTAYKGHDAIAIYDPNVEILPAEVQKSSAFDATELPDPTLMQSGGVRAYKAKTEADPTEKRSASHLENRSSRPDAPKTKPEEPTSKLIAEAAAAKEEEDRAIARGSYVVPTDNPLLASSKSTNSEPMTIQQTIQSVQLLTRSAMQRDPNRDDARVASSPIYNTGGRNALFSGRGGLAGRIAPRRYKSPSRTSAPLPSIPDDVEEK